MTSHPPKTINHQRLFRSLETPYIVFAADDPKFTIVEQNDAHARVSLVNHEDVLGKPLLEAYPDNSDEYKKTGKSELIESIRLVIKSGKRDVMPNLRYDIRDKEGNYEQRIWSLVHSPVKDETGRVVAVYQATEDITERLETERQLKLTKYQLDQTLANGSVGIWTWDIKAQKVHGDANIAHMYGLGAAAAHAGLSLDEFVNGIYEKDRERVVKKIQAAIEKRSGFEQEYRTIDIEGSMRWVIARGRVEVDENGELDRFPGVVIDITERKDAEQVISESENKLRFMADFMPQLVWMARPDGYREYFNQKWYQFTGAGADENEGSGWSSFVHPDDKKRVVAAWRHSYTTGELYEVEYRLYHSPTDSYRWLIGRALPFRDRDGKILKWYGTSTDIDAQKRSAQLEAFLANASKKLSASLDYKTTLKKVSQLCVPDIADWCSVDLYDKDNDTYEQVSVAHADPRKVTLAIEHRKHNPPSRDGKTGVSKVIRTGKPEFYPVISDDMLKTAIKNPNTLKFMFSLDLHSIIIAPIKVNNEPMGAISFVSTDSGRYYTQDDLHMAEELANRISLAIANTKLYDESVKELKQRKELEKQLLIEKQKLESRVRERTEQLQLTNQGLRDEIVRRQEVEKELLVYGDNLTRSNQELQDFAYVASHDLQEPLRKIQAFGNLLQTEYGKELGEGSDYIDRMRSAASRMSKLISDLLMFSRVTTQAKPSEKVDLDVVVSEVLSDLEERINETEGEVTVQDLPVVFADPTHMRQLFQNLIGNALKFHKSGHPPKVTVSYDASDETYHIISISDNGIGFDQKYVDRIFAVFQRLHDRDAYEGTGIGLAVCRKIVERYDGTIKATSAKGKGAVFIIQLPKKRSKKS